ncbi:uncharacterized protein LOC129317546 [Prosopis cineraria]|uniref:uncharacterized protein LOC129317546 n=1 Tax=Prosopis cineraria TaxID=364024 RepID=UPI00240F26AE|nr:uncharacterized protein LOC129317546 [Prosopis cineraria]
MQNKPESQTEGYRHRTHAQLLDCSSQVCHGFRSLVSLSYKVTVRYRFSDRRIWFGFLFLFSVSRFQFRAANCEVTDSRSAHLKMTSENASTTASTQSVRSKTDPTWEHCAEVKLPDGKIRLKCLYCAKEFAGGGIHRMKQHLAGKKGDAISCKKVPADVRYRLEENLKEIRENKGKRQDSYEEDNPYGPNVTPLESHDGNSEEISTPQSQTLKEIQSQSQTQLGKRKAPIDKYFAPRTTPGAQPGIRSALAGKEPIRRADMAFAKWMYDCCIPLNVVNSAFFQPMIDAFTAIGPGYKGPSYHAMRTKLLLDTKKEVQLMVDSFRNFWDDTGCTIMADGWQDQANRQLINFLVYSPRGIVFIKSVDASDIVKDAQNLCNLFTEMVDFVGVTNVVHLVTDNAANYKAAGRLLCDKFPSIFWSPCAAHCLNLILGDIGKTDIVIGLATRASMVTKFVYNHAFLLAWLRKREGWTEIIRPGVTRFATTFIALKSIHEHKHDLQALVTSKVFLDSRYSKGEKAKDATLIVLDNQFWNDCKIVVQIVSPLIRLLRIVDADERPSLGYVYDGMYRARKTIKNILMNKKPLYKPYTRIIKKRWDSQLRQKLHAAAYFLNPVFFYDKQSFSKKPEVMAGFLDVLDKTITSNKTKFVQESLLYQDRVDSFGRSLAISSINSLRPNEWWKMFGDSAPNVKKLAMRLLSQTSSSSGCERNWSVFERIHSKKRNRLEHKRLNDLVFIHYNLRLRNRVYNKKRSFDPIDYESIGDIEYWIMEDEDSPTLNYDEIEEAMLYDDTIIPQVSINQDEGNNEGGGNEVSSGGGCSIIEGLDLRSFAQEDVETYSYDDLRETHAWLNQDPPIFDKS